MDSKFLEYWGQLMINAAKGQKQLEAFQKLLVNSVNGLPLSDSSDKKNKEDEDVMSLVAKVYGADKLSEGIPAYWQMMQNVAGTFQTSFQKYLRMIGAVPRDKYEILREKYEALEKKVAEMEKTIIRLQTQSDVKPDEPEGLTQGIKDLVLKQGEQFQEIMKSFQKLYQDNGSSPNDSSSSEKR